MKTNIKKWLIIGGAGVLSLANLTGGLLAYGFYGVAQEQKQQIKFMRLINEQTNAQLEQGQDELNRIKQVIEHGITTEKLIFKQQPQPQPQQPTQIEI
ncbi:hypothetical protein ACFBZI_11765 [Moraxella sp. ZJ142]|uniref:hypothetical protein n=1 Tax=Moraxella marmotae TaxID=3344520 RepID=UPI0035D3F274